MGDRYSIYGSSVVSTGSILVERAKEVRRSDASRSSLSQTFLLARIMESMLPEEDDDDDDHHAGGACCRDVVRVEVGNI
jgi:hypothetical protein